MFLTKEVIPLKRYLFFVPGLLFFVSAGISLCSAFEGSGTNYPLVLAAALALITGVVSTVLALFVYEHRIGSSDSTPTALEFEKEN